MKTAGQIGGGNKYQTEVVKMFNRISGKYNTRQLWDDFVQCAACSISNAVDKWNYTKREEMYQNIIQKYDMEVQEMFPIIFAHICKGIEENMDQDFLGDLYMKLEFGNRNTGQFFTPYNVCVAMAMLGTKGQIEKINRDGWISINDCACGAGATLLAAANVLKEQGINYQRKCLFVAQDIDLITAQMCYLQLSLFGCAGYVVVGNTLSSPVQCMTDSALMPVHGDNIWYTPMYFHQDWECRRVRDVCDYMKKRTRKE